MARPKRIQASELSAFDADLETVTPPQRGRGPRKVRLTPTGAGFHAAFSHSKCKAGDVILSDHADILIERGLAVEA